MPQQTPMYIHGHHESVLRSHSWRTAENSAAYLLPSLKADMAILDIGCGPGTITVDFAALVPQGYVTGLDRSEDVLDQARATAASRGVQNVTFALGDIFNLDFPDNSFDVVHVHQVLQHVHDPVKALREMRRVAKPGGIIAAREADFDGMTWYPEIEGLREWRSTYHQIAKSVGGDPNAGRKLHVWARLAGFEALKISCSAGTWCYQTSAEREWWSNMWAERTVSSSYAEIGKERGIVSDGDLNHIAQAWRDWGAHEDGWFLVWHGQIICRV